VKHKFVVGLMVFMLLVGIQVGGAQAQEPVVYAALFFSPSCGHCHYVITEFLPPLQEEYGAQLQVLFIDVSQPAGSTLFYAGCDTFEVPSDECGYVPTLIIGDTVLVGSGDIPAQMPDLVRDGIAAGGIDLPAIPGLREAYEASIAEQPAGESINEAAAEDAPAAAPVSTTYRETTWQDRLKQDSLGNSFALVVLAILCIGLITQLGYGTRQLTNRYSQQNTGKGVWVFSKGLALMTVAIAGTLVLESSSISLPTVLAIGVIGGMIVVGWGVWQVDQQAESTGIKLPNWVIPAISL
jgi:thiol-disulfide isomerase/thioredoxin